jgi:Zn-dependent protease with chaperone function
LNCSNISLFLDNRIVEKTFMPTPVSFYPITPGGVPAAVTAPSAAFKKEVSKVMASVVLFFAVYVLLILLAVLLAIGCMYAGIALIIAIPRFITIMVGAGLVGLGIMVFVFLVKFIFSVTRYDRTGIIKIRETDHPKLFAFIRQLTKDTQTPFPKHIYLSPEVNACVFYDSSFLSMFLPVKKNLQIGLGLVNAVNLSEFKAIMAHEFGHFSQRSMKLGSFVYNVNRVIYNMLYENTGYARSLQSWANISGYFAFFAGLTVHIVNGIQWVLKHMYGLINKNYMSLSREMEFHADAVAASVSGSANCISALRRAELAGTCYSNALQKCNDLFKQKYITANLYPNQQSVTKQIALDFKLELKNDLPVVNDDFLKTLNLTRVNFKDQWASHPALEERETHLTSLNVKADSCNDSAWVLFNEAEKWQRQLTEKIYQQLELPADIQTIDGDAFEKILQQDIALYSLPEVFNNFYDKRQITMLNVDEIAADESAAGEFDAIFSTQNATLNAKITAGETDVHVLKAIAGKQIDIKTFDFDGEKYDRAQAETIADKLQNELTAMKQQLELADKEAYRYFYKLALKKDVVSAGELKKGYAEFFDLRKQSEFFLKDAQGMLKELEPLYSGAKITLNEVHEIITRLKTEETHFKEHLRTWSTGGAFDHAAVLKERVQKFLESSYAYYSADQFFNSELNDLHSIAAESWQAVNEFLFRKFKQLLEVQVRLIKT